MFQNTPESLCSTVTWKDEEDRIIWVYRVQDTPGFGDDLNILNNINNMLTYIENQNSKWLQVGVQGWLAGWLWGCLLAVALAGCGAGWLPGWL